MLVVRDETKKYDCKSPHFPSVFKAGPIIQSSQEKTGCDWIHDGDMFLQAENARLNARINKLGHGQWSARILLEEPFDRTNAARAVCSDQKWAIILESLLSTKDVVEHGGSGLGLADLGPSNSYRR